MAPLENYWMSQNCTHSVGRTNTPSRRVSEGPSNGLLRTGNRLREYKVALRKLKMTTVRNPAVSVLTSVYNAERYVGIAIESILNQTLTDFEFIIIDDCSSDSSWDIIQKYASLDKRIIASKNEVNLKGCNTLNKGFTMATGRYVAINDNDDWSYPDRLEKQFLFMELHPDVGIVGGTMEIMNESGKVTGKRKYHLHDKEIRKYIFRYSPFSHPLVMYRKSILDKVGYSNPVYAPADDYELYFRIGKVSKFANLPDVLLKYRVVPNSMTHNLTKQMELTTLMVRRLYGKDNGYKAGLIDRLYGFLHYLSVFVMPSRMKIWLFNLLRNAS